MAELYKIGVEIALTGTLLQGLETIASKLMGIKTHVKDVEGGFNRWALALGGAAAIVASGVIAKGLDKSVSSGAELVKQQTLLGTMFKDQDERLKAINSTTLAAQAATHKVIGTTIAENIKGIRELMGMMPTLADAQGAYVPVMQGAKVLESFTGSPAEQNMQLLAKAIELRGGGTDPKTGQLDPERFVREVDAATKAIEASGGLANARQLLNAIQQAGPMARMMTDADAFYKSILTAIMDMGGFRAGTALTAVGRQLLGGKMGVSTAEEMENMGLLPAGSWHKAGNGVSVEPNALKGMDLLRGDEASIGKWFNDILLTQFALHGITAPADIQQELYRLFGTETARRLAGLFIQNKAQITKDSSLYDNAQGSKAYGDVSSGDYAMNVANLQKAVESFLQAFGAPMVPIAIDALQKLAGAMNSLADVAISHPTEMKEVGVALAGIAVAMATLGGTAVIAGAIALSPTGAIAAGVAGLSVMLSGLAALNIGGIREFFAKDAEDLKEFFGFLGGLAGSIHLENIFPPSLARDIHAAADGVVAFDHGITHLIDSLGGALNFFSHSVPAFPGGGNGGPNGGRGFITPNSFVPMPRANHTQTASAGDVWLDGAKVGKVMWQRAIRDGDHPTTAAFLDTHATYVAGDYGFQTG